MTAMQNAAADVQRESVRLHAAFSVALRVLGELECRCSEEQVSAEQLLNTLAGEEETLFSPVPPYVVPAMQAEARATAASLGDDAHYVSPYHAPSPDEDVLAGKQHFARVSRAYVNPGVPLQLPYDHAHERGKPNDTRVSTYHDLFHPSSRSDEQAAAAALPQRTPRASRQRVAGQSQSVARARRAQAEQEAPRRVMRVGPDFVPACAYVGRRRNVTVSPPSAEGTPA